MADIIYPGKAPTGTLGREFLPANFDIELYKGDYLSFSINLKNPDGTPLDLTGFTSRSQVRDYIDATVVYEFETTMEHTLGIVHLLLPSSITKDILPGSYIWDFQVTDPSLNVRTYLAGDVKVYDEVTR